jgi:FMN phosphatase YigB (HAD superfamily)
MSAITSTYLSAVKQSRLPLGYPVLYLDFHGTLSASKFWSNIPDRSLARSIQDFVFRDNPELLAAWMIGQISSWQLHRLLEAEFKTDEIWHRFVAQSIRLHIKGLDVIPKLRQHFLVALATTNVDSFTNITCRSKSLLRHFDSVINSADFGQTKDQAELFFKYASTITGHPISESVLIDDSSKVCDAFRSLGGVAVRVANPDETTHILSAVAGALSHRLKSHRLNADEVRTLFSDYG